MREEIWNAEKPEYIYVDKSFNKLHGNVYKIGQIEPIENDGRILNIFSCELYNQLEGYCKGLDGHYSIVYTYPYITFRIWKSSDYGSFTYVRDVEYTGFLENNLEITEYITRLIGNTMVNKVPYKEARYTSQAWFDEDIVNHEWPKDWQENHPDRIMLQKLYDIKKSACIEIIKELSKQ